MPDHKTLHQAMAAVFAEMPGIGRDSNNPYFRSKYTSLDQIIHTVRPILARHGLYFIQRPVPADPDFVSVETVFCHVSGETLDAGTLVLPAKPIPKKNEEEKPANAQSYGSAVTYAKRYGLAAALGICDIEDDDGNAAAHGGAENGQPVRREVPKSPAGKEAFKAAVIAVTGHTDTNAISDACRAACLATGIGANSTEEEWAEATRAVRDGRVEFKPKNGYNK